MAENVESRNFFRLVEKRQNVLGTKLMMILPGTHKQSPYKDVTAIDYMNIEGGREDC